MNTESILQALIVAAVTAVVTAIVTGWVNARVMDQKLRELTARIVRIENYLNGLLKEYRNEK